MASERVEQSDARISNTRTVTNLCLVYLFNTPPDLSMMLVWTYYVDALPLTFLTFCPVLVTNLKKNFTYLLTKLWNSLASQERL